MEISLRTTSPVSSRIEQQEATGRTSCTKEAGGSSRAFISTSERLNSNKGAMNPCRASQHPTLILPRGDSSFPHVLSLRRGRNTRQEWSSRRNPRVYTIIHEPSRSSHSPGCAPLDPQRRPVRRWFGQLTVARAICFRLNGQARKISASPFGWLELKEEGFGLQPRQGRWDIHKCAGREFRGL